MLRDRNHGLTIYNPFYDLEHFGHNFFSQSYWNSFKTDIHDDGKSFILEADLPGLKKEDIEIQVENNTLTIHAERHSEIEQKDAKGSYVCCERAYGSFSRSFDVSGIDTEHIKASYADGVLKLVLPKKEQHLSGSHRLEIE